MGGKAPNWPIFNIPHGLHRGLFFIPMLYAAYKFRVKGVIVIALFSMLIFLPRALFISPYPYALLRAIMFVIVLWSSGFCLAMALNATTMRKQAEEKLRESEKILSEIVQGNSIPTFVINKEHIITHWNKAIEVLTGLPAKEMYGTKKQWMPFYAKEKVCMADLIVDGASEEVVSRHYHRNKKSSLISGAYESESPLPDGVWLRFTASPLYNQKGQIIGAIETLEDITGRKKAEEKLQVAMASFHNVVQKSVDGIIVVDRNGIVRFVNLATEIIFNHKADELIGELFGFALVDTAFKEIDIFRPDKKMGVGEMRVTETQWEDSPAYLVSIRDITERKQAEEKLRYLSFHDSLTELYNRTYFEEEMKRINTKRNYPIAVIMADINGLKLVNDTLGHNNGDKLLKNTARILKSVAREGDIIARIGGDEFAVILPHTEENAAQAFCNRFRDAYKKHNSKTTLLKLSVALGYAMQSGQYKDMEGVFEQADENMYTEKLSDTASREKHIIDTFRTILVIRDPHTEKHAERLQDLAEALGKSIELSGFKLKRLRLLALLHDIGKIGTPDNILFKPDKLTEEEWEIMKKHTENGYKMANNIPQLVPLARGTLHHHERWDGTGYPKGLKGEEIPVLSRIISIVDAYDVMLTERPYKKVMTEEEAIKELKRCAGTQFDPELVEKFLKILTVQNLKLSQTAAL